MSTPSRSSNSSDSSAASPADTPGVSRRGFLAGLGVTGMAGVLAACGQSDDGNSGAADASASGDHPGGVASPDTIIAFDGEHQAGIATPPQRNGVFVAYTIDRAGKNSAQLREHLRKIMMIWTSDARRLTQGGTPLADLESELSNAPVNLTITVGWGPKLIEDAGLAKKTPGWVATHTEGLPPFKGDELEEDFSHGDLLLQVCGDDLTAITHALRVLTRGTRDLCTPKWTQRGFLDAPTGETPRNLFGFKDGTAQPESDEDWAENIWDDQGGTAMVVRRINFDMPNWEALDRTGREIVFGREIVSGAPLGQKNEFDEIDLNKTDERGLPFIDNNSHVGIAAGEGTHMRRRGFNWDGEITPLAESGLVFVCFQNDPDKAFTPLQRRLAETDRLNEWITHVGSAVFWCPPGTQAGGYWGERLLEG